MEQKPKSYWERPEGTTGMLLGATVAVTGAWAFIHYEVLSFMLGMAQDAFHTTLLLGATGGLVYAASDRRTRTLAVYGYRSLTRGITSIFKTIDPIGILKSYQEDAERALADVRNQVAKLAGQLQALRRKIAKRTADASSSLDAARAAQSRQGRELGAYKAHLMKESAATLEEMVAPMEGLHRRLSALADHLALVNEKLKVTIEVKADERVSIRAATSAMRAAWRAANGDPDRRALFDETLESLADDYGKQLGEIESFLDLSTSVLEGVDVDGGHVGAEVLHALDELDKRPDAVLLAAPPDRLPVPTPAAAYDKLLR